MSDPNFFKIDIPWRVLAASPDMMDVTNNNRRYPPAWRSSLAISVFEPDVSDLPAKLCGQKITFVKVTCSITGFQSSSAITYGDVSLNNRRFEGLERLTTEYLGCYGVLLNVAFFPPSSSGLGNPDPNPDLTQFPHVLDFLPKSRELIRPITESGELLTGSTRSVTIDHSLTNTHKDETKLGAEASIEAGVGSEDSADAGINVKGKIEHTWGMETTSSQGSNFDTGQTQESHQGYSTHLDQLYSLLTGYHNGTNRATFIMLPRPGTLQPTDRRTFALGLRVIEGVQDFFFIVSQPEEQNGLCIEATLNTGHYPEAVTLSGEKFPREKHVFNFHVYARTPLGQGINFGSDDRPQDTFHFPLTDQGGLWLLDYDRADYGIELQASDNLDKLTWGDQTISIPEDHRDDFPKDIWIQPLVDYSGIEVHGRLGTPPSGLWGYFSSPSSLLDPSFSIIDRMYKIHVWRPMIAPTIDPTADICQLLVTTRSLNVCYQSVNGCPEVIPWLTPNLPLAPDWVGDLVGSHFRANMSLDQIHSTIQMALVASTSIAGSEALLKPFTGTDYFSLKVSKIIPDAIGNLKVSQAVKFKRGDPARGRIGNLSIKKFLAAGLSTYTGKNRLPKDVVLKVRQDVLQFVERKLE